MSEAPTKQSPNEPPSIKCGLCHEVCGKTPYAIRIYNFTLRKPTQEQRTDTDTYARKFTICEACMVDTCERLGIKE